MAAVADVSLADAGVAVVLVEDSAAAVAAAGPVEAGDSAVADLLAHGDDMKSWIDSHLTANEIQKISQIVTEAEKQTEGEIVPIIVRRSSAVGHVKWILTGLMTLIFVISESVYIHNHWNSINVMAPPTAFILFYILSIYLGKIPWFQRILTPNEDEIAQVHNRAELEFYRTQIRKTTKRTGILIFVSVMERRVVILADEGIAAEYPTETWDELVRLMTDEFKKGNVFAGFEKAISRCGKILQTKLPAQNHNTNQIGDQLIIKE